jgi:hypothetical protein
MSRCRSLVVASLLALVGATCTLDRSAVGALRQALHQEYPGARFEVAFTHGPRNLELTVDSAGFRNYKLDKDQRHRIGQAMAHFVLQHYSAAANLDTITIQIIEERSGALVWKSWAFDRESFGVASLR